MLMALFYLLKDGMVEKIFIGALAGDPFESLILRDNAQIYRS